MLDTSRGPPGSVEKCIWHGSARRDVSLDLLIPLEIMYETRLFGYRPFENINVPKPDDIV